MYLEKGGAENGDASPNQKKITVDLFAVGLIALLSDAAWAMFFSTATLYGTFMKASIALIGIVFSGIGLTRAISSLPLGVLSDRIGRKLTIILGLIALLLGFFLLMVVFNPVQLVPLGMLIGFGTVAVFPVGFAYIADFTESKSKGLAISVYATLMGIGFSVGPIIGGYLSERWGYKATYIASVLFLLLGLALAWKVLKTNDDSNGKLKSLSLRDMVKNLRVITRKRETFFAAGAMFTYAVSFSTIFGFFPLYGEKLGLTPTLIGFLITARIFASTIVRPLAGMLTKGINSLNLMIGSLIPCSVVLFILPFLDSFYLLLGALSLEGLCYGILLISSNTLIAETSNKNEMGATMGLWATAEHAGTAVGPLILGFIGERWGLDALFRSAFLIMMVGVLYLEIKRRSLPSEKLS